MDEVTALVIHHSASPLYTTRDQIAEWHIEKGWDDIGYHYVIEQDGEIKVGRPFHITGAHALPNTGRIGICVVGDNTSSDQYWTQAQEFSLDEFVEAFSLLFPLARICGHREIMEPGYTECPGRNIEGV